MSTQVTELLRSLGMPQGAAAYSNLDGDANLMSSISLDDALITILTAESDARLSRRQATVLKRAGIPMPADLSAVSYDEERGPDFARGMARARSLSWLDLGQNLLLLGCSGAGKSFLASAIARAVAMAGREVLFVNAPDFGPSTARLRNESPEAYVRLRRRLQRTTLLAIDDFSLVPPTEDEMRVFYDIANDRSGIKSTLVTSQKDPRRWVEDMGISALGEAVAGRLSGNAFTIELRNGSRRAAAPEPPGKD